MTRWHGSLVIPADGVVQSAAAEYGGGADFGAAVSRQGDGAGVDLGRGALRDRLGLVRSRD